MTQRRIFEILEVAKPGDRASRAFDILIVALIAGNVLASVCATVPSILRGREGLFNFFEIASVVVFTIEYLLRIWSCVQHSRFRSPVSGRIRFALRPIILIDLLAILPFYLPMLISADLRMLRALRLLRILRVLKFGRYSSALQTLANVIMAKKEELVITCFVLGVLLIIAASGVYYAEHEAQPDVFSSIPAAMWWGIVTLSTVGYGDVYPVTPVGKLLGAIVAILGVGMFALPAGILGGAFTEEMSRGRSKSRDEDRE